MHCYNCGYLLPNDDIHDCPLCGMKFPINCHYCHSPNPLLAKFCIGCGTKLKNMDTNNSIQNFDILTENRKNVAVMFADVSGFTALSERMDPEELRELINDAFNYITKPVYELEGTIDKYIGDCIMILFGAKHSHSDDPRRAVVCGMEMIKLIKEFTEERLSDKEVSLDLSIGINYGLVVTGSVGNFFDKDYTVMGDIVNTAQRLQTAADKGTILTSESIYIETKDVIEFSKHKEIVVKNKEKYLKAYSPIHLHIATEVDHMALIERDKELNLLNNLLNNPALPRCVEVIGEAGIGKTSLIKQFLSNTTDHIKNIWLTCNSIFQNRVHYVLANILLKIMNLESSDSNRIKLNRLKSYIDFILKDYAYSEEEITKNYQFMSLVMGLDRETEFQHILHSMNYDDLQREILNQLTIFFLNTLKKNTFVFIIDDIQWSDKASLNILKQLVRAIPKHDSMFIFASRYYLEELPLQYDNENLIKLENLSKSGIYNLSSRLLRCNSIDEDLYDVINKYTSGNPLFIKEFITTLKRKEKYFIKDDIAYIDENKIISLPNTIESLILANIADLDETSKHILQVASVIGKEFNVVWISNLLGINIDHSLNQLIKQDLIKFKKITSLLGEVEKNYVFNQDTLREVIYDSLLNKTKQELHNRIGKFIEETYVNDLENYYEVLSTHFKLAGLDKKARNYYYKTAIKHKNDFNYKAAIEFYNSFFEMSKYGAVNSTNHKVINALIEIGQIYTIMTDYHQALKHLEEALTMTTLTDDIYTIKIMIASIYRETGNFVEALTLLNDIEKKIRKNTDIYGKLLQLKCSILGIMGNNEALDIAEKSEEILLKVKDFENLSETMSQAGLIHFFNGDINNALYYLNKAHQYAEKTNNIRALDKISGNLGIVYHAIGMVSKALKYLNMSLELSKKLSNLRSYVENSINLGIVYMDKGIFNKAESLFAEALYISRDVSSVLNECISLANLGDLSYEIGDYDNATDYYNKSLTIAKKQGLPIEEGINYLGLAKINLEYENYSFVETLLEQSYKIFKETNEVSYISDYYMTKSLCAFKKGNHDLALEHGNKAMGKAKEANNDMKKLKSMQQIGDIYNKIGDFEKAIEYYDKAINLAELLESDYEKGKGYYKKYTVLFNFNQNKANEELLKSKRAIEKLDKSRWTQIINNK